MEFTWFTFAIAATFFWGLSDVFFKKGTDPNDRYSHLRILIMIGLMMGLQAIFELYKLNWQYDIKILFPIFQYHFIYIIHGNRFFGYRYLLISVGSPVASTSGAIAGILSFKVLGKPCPLYNFCRKLNNHRFNSIGNFRKREAEKKDL